MTDQPSPHRRSQFRLRTLMIAVTLFCLFAAIFTAYYPVRYKYEGPWLYFLAFGLFGASGGTFFGRPGLGIALGLVAGTAVFYIFPGLLVNPDAGPF